jgi:hypothetical protein
MTLQGQGVKQHLLQREACVTQDGKALTKVWGGGGHNQPAIEGVHDSRDGIDAQQEPNCQLVPFNHDHWARAKANPNGSHPPLSCHLILNSTRQQAPCTYIWGEEQWEFGHAPQEL